MNLRFQVMEKPVARIVRAKSSGRHHEVCDLLVADNTGSVRLTLWNDDIEDVEPGKTYELVNGVIKLFDECMILSRGRTSSIRLSHRAIPELKDKPDMSKPFAWMPKKKHKRTSAGRSFEGRPGREGRGYCSRKSF